MYKKNTKNYKKKYKKSTKKSTNSKKRTTTNQKTFCLQKFIKRVKHFNITNIEMKPHQRCHQN